MVAQPIESFRRRTVHEDILSPPPRAVLIGMFQRKKVVFDFSTTNANWAAICIERGHPKLGLMLAIFRSHLVFVLFEPTIHSFPTFPATNVPLERLSKKAIYTNSLGFLSLVELFFVIWMFGFPATRSSDDSLRVSLSVAACNSDGSLWMSLPVTTVFV